MLKDYYALLTKCTENRWTSWRLELQTARYDTAIRSYLVFKWKWQNDKGGIIRQIQKQIPSNILRKCRKICHWYFYQFEMYYKTREVKLWNRRMCTWSMVFIVNEFSVRFDPGTNRTCSYISYTCPIFDDPLRFKNILIPGPTDFTNILDSRLSRE